MAQQPVKKEHVLELLLQRPMEPVFVPKGSMKVVFDIPQTYVAPEYQYCFERITNENRRDECVFVKIKTLSPHPNEVFEFAQKLGRHDQLSDFIPEHQEFVSRVTKIFHSAKDFEVFLSLAVYARDNLNPSLFARAYSMAVLHRGDTIDVRLPSVSSINPHKFFSSEIMSRVLEQAGVLKDYVKPIEEILTASSLEPEHRVAYFREDLGVNSHHWKWHMVYPNEGPDEMVKKDRRGELFYYMHQQMIARYNAERLSNNLGKVRRFNNFREPISEAYFPKLGDKASRNYPPRHANSVLRDVNRKKENFYFDIADLDVWRTRIYEAIDSGTVKTTDGGKRSPLNPSKDMDTGIDIIGNLLESSILSVDRNYYGNFHSAGHITSCVIHDPNHAHLEPFSIMGDFATACRDPFFYRWHAMVDHIFQRYKKTLPSYTDKELSFKDVQIRDVEIKEKEIAEGNHDMKKKNTLHTNWQKNYIDVAKGLDFQASKNPVYIAVTHLQYKVFDYYFNVYNGGQPRYGTVRIFIAPKLDEDGQTMKFNEQRTSFIEMDKFVQYFETGTNVFERCSCESSVTILPEDTFRAFENDVKKLTAKERAAFFCGCGWPNHMLVPKGTCEGMAFDLFVMISDFEFDNVTGKPDETNCGAPSYCGVRDKKYPDKRPMGFPFDRDLKKIKDGKPEPDSEKTLEDFAKDKHNIFSTLISVRFKNKVCTLPEISKQAGELGCQGAESTVPVPCINANELVLKPPKKSDG